MSRVKVNLPDQTESEIRRLVDQGEFLDYDKAVEDLLSRGISAYETTDDDSPGIEEDTFNTAADEQQDPAMRTDDPDDGYTL